MIRDLKNNLMLRNFSSLTIIQISNYIFPLITFPYLVRVLGPEKFGLIHFAIAFIAYFGTLVDYGFTLSATREISLHRENKEELSKIFSSVIIIKLMLVVLSIFILIPVVSVFSKFSDNSLVYYLTFISVIGQALYPIWFFQGIEQMKYLLYITVSSKAASVVLIFILVTSPDHLLTVIIINSGAALLMGLSGIIVVVFHFKIRLKLQSSSLLKYHFFEGGYIFLSTAAINIYTTTNIFLLGIFTNDSIVGYFSAADKIRIAVQSTFSTISQTIYPRLSKQFEESKREAVKFVGKILYGVGSLVFILCLIIVIFAKDIIAIILGPGYEPSVILLQILGFLPFIIFLSNISGIQTMLNLGYKKEFTKILAQAALLNTLLALVLIQLFAATGTAVSMLITEIFVTVTMIIFLNKKEIKIFGHV